MIDISDVPPQATLKRWASRLHNNVTGVFPQYQGHWSTQATCDSDCGIILDSAELYRGSWHGSVSPQENHQSSSITLRFTGVAVYVYNILANDIRGATFPTGTNIMFSLDGEQDGRFVHIPSDSTDFEYNFLVYARTNLRNEEHVLVIQLNPISLCLFDYAVYTCNDQSSTMHISTSTPLSESFSASKPTSLSVPALSSTSLRNTISTLLPTTSSGPTSNSTSRDMPSSQVPVTSSLADSLARAATPVRSIVGGTIGGGVLLVILAALVLYRPVRRRARSRPPSTTASSAEIPRPEWATFQAMDAYDELASASPSSQTASLTSSDRRSVADGDDAHYGIIRISLPAISNSKLYDIPDGSVVTSAAEHHDASSLRTSVRAVVDDRSQPEEGMESSSCIRTSIRRPAQQSAPIASPARSLEPNTKGLSQQLASLQAEVAQLRAQQELLTDAPPRYDEAP
ncbi:hypothetical protein BD309DRAFT_96951 [Dichomitus squalens]|nr:hypothetical protein BD309DRAFT_96951 [Dichomitus squalens]